MPCLIITGYPSSGKTTIAEKLRERALQHPSQSIKNVTIINEESLFSSSSSSSSSFSVANPKQTKYHCYKDSNAEKQTRSALKTEFDKQANMAASKKSLVILDSLNYIKGYRYELHCISKAFGELHGILWIACPPDLAMTWNQKRVEKELAQSDGMTNDEKDYLFYTSDMMDGLMRRYEPPDNRNRWDKPLYTVDLSTVLDYHQNNHNSKIETDIDCDNANANANANTNTETKDQNKNTASKQNSVAKNVLEKSVYNMHSLSDAIDADKPARDNTDRTRSQRNSRRREKESSSLTALPQSLESDSRTKLEKRLDQILDAFLESKPLKEGMSTQKPVVAASDMLHQVDSITKKLTSAVLKAQQKVPLGGKLSVLPSHATTKTISFSRRVNLPELRRLQRQYVKWVSAHPPDDPSEIGISVSFLDYLETQI